MTGNKLIYIFLKLDHNTDKHFVWKNNQEKHKVEIRDQVCETQMAGSMENKDNQILLILE